MLYGTLNIFIQILEMEYAQGALAYGLSNTSMLLTACLKSSLDVKYFFRILLKFAIDYSV
jgi:hypothetical protein